MRDQIAETVAGSAADQASQSAVDDEVNYLFTFRAISGSLP